MEERLKAKIDEALEILTKKVEQYNKDATQFINDAFPKEIRRMAKELADANRMCFKYQIPDVGWLWINQYGSVKVRNCGGDVISNFDIPNRYVPEKGVYNNDIINSINSCTSRLERELNIFNKAKEITPVVIERLTTQYKNTVEYQSNTLDDILTRLGSETETTKHIKVTVEWV